jgi:4-amino-4-deoxy-L-arabinose transferase-like glycosyltransferase
LSQIAEWGKELGSPREAPHGARKLDSAERESFVEVWLQHHFNAVAATAIAAGFVIRLFVASRGFLNPDEALHYVLFEQPSAFLAYKASLSNAHPPLLFLVLYFWHLLGHSELMLRLPSVFAGTAFCWFTFKWMQISFSRAASLIALIIVAFAPTLIGLSAELREYALLLFFIAAALYYFEAAVQEKSARKMWYFSIAFYLAILSHYSAVFFVLAMGFYALARIAGAHLPRRLIATWVIGQAGAAALYAILYVTHIAKLNGVIPLWAGPYNRFYFHGGFADIFGFLQEYTPYIFRYMFGQRYTGEIMFWLWVIGITILFVKGLTSGRGYPRSTQLGILLLLPFMALWGAAVAGKYPYVPSRHTVFLAPFAIAAVSALLASILGQKLWRGLLIATLLMSVSSAFGYSSDAYITSEDQKRGLMNAALDYVHLSIPRNEVILLDYQSSVTVAYYLCTPEQTRQFYASEGEFIPLNCNGRSFIAMNYRTWVLNDKNFSYKFQKLTHQYELKPGHRVWVFQTSWIASLDTDLQQHLPEFRDLHSQRFGKSIVIIPFIVSPELLPLPDTTALQP